MRKKNVKPTINPEYFLSNPLANDLIIKVTRTHDAKTFKRESDGTMIPKEYDIEQDRCTKVYHSPANRQLVSLLKPAPRALYNWLIYEIDPGKDYVWINKWRFMKEHKMNSINTYKAAIFDLVRYNVLCKSVVMDVYWINPKIFFCGSRVKKYADKVEIVHEYALPDKLVNLRPVVKKEEQPVMAVLSRVG